MGQHGSLKLSFSSNTGLLGGIFKQWMANFGVGFMFRFFVVAAVLISHLNAPLSLSLIAPLLPFLPPSLRLSLAGST